MTTRKRDLISMEDLSREEVELLLVTAESFLPALKRDFRNVPTRRGRADVGCGDAGGREVL